MALLRDFAQGRRALGEERVGVAAAALRDARGEREVAAAGRGLDGGEQVGGALEADADVGPGRFADGGGEGKERCAIGRRQGLE